jgi:hypothetical protein
VRTAVRTDDFSFAGVLSAIRQCRTAVTSGPFASLSAAHDNRRYFPGDTARAAEFPVEVSGLSSAEFGPLSRLALFKGTLGRTEEKVLDVSLKNERAFERTVLFRARAQEPCYFRAEVSSGNGNDVFLGMTSPLWAKPE